MRVRLLARFTNRAASSVTWLEKCGSGRHFTKSCFEMIELTKKSSKQGKLTLERPRNDTKPRKLCCSQGVIKERISL